MIKTQNKGVFLKMVISNKVHFQQAYLLLNSKLKSISLGKIKANITEDNTALQVSYVRKRSVK